MSHARVPFVTLALLASSALAAEPKAAQPKAAQPAAAPSTPPTSTAGANPALAQPLNPAAGKEVGPTYEAYLTPWQESDEEEATPATTPKQFRSTTPSISRAQREAAGHRAHGVVRFSKDLSRAWVDVKIEGIDPATINMFHIHCGKPGILGPILVDFSLATDLPKSLSSGVFTVEIRDEHLVKTAQHGHGVVAAFTMGCVIPSPSLGSTGPVKVSTIAGMAQLAKEGELYFNLHTTGQVYFGDIRGQLQPAAAK